MRPTVVLTDKPTADIEIERAILDEAGYDLFYDIDRRDADAVREVVPGAVGLIVNQAHITREVMEAAPNLQVIARYGVGVDTINLRAASELGIMVTNVTDYCVEEVADHTVALLLGAARGVVHFDRILRSGGWALADVHPTYRLRGRTLGLVGFGRIARAVAERAAAFGLRVIATDPFVPAEEVRAAGVEPVELDVLLATSHYVSLHAPLNAQTRHLIDAPAFGLMRRDAYLINASRGALVDPTALYAAIAEGSIAGAALDVWEQEPLPADDPLRRLDEVIGTSHTAYYSVEAVEEMKRKATTNAVEALAGCRPPYLVNPDVLEHPAVQARRVEMEAAASAALTSARGSGGASAAPPTRDPGRAS